MSTQWPWCDHKTTIDERDEAVIHKLMEHGQSLSSLSPKVVKAPENFGMFIRDLRELCGLNHIELAERAGLHPSFIVMLENGVVLPEELSDEVIENLAKVLNTPFWLLGAYRSASLVQ